MKYWWKYWIWNGEENEKEKEKNYQQIRTFATIERNWRMKRKIKCCRSNSSNSSNNNYHDDKQRTMKCEKVRKDTYSKMCVCVYIKKKCTYTEYSVALQRREQENTYYISVYTHILYDYTNLKRANKLNGRSTHKYLILHKPKRRSEAAVENFKKQNVFFFLGLFFGVVEWCIPFRFGYRNRTECAAFIIYIRWRIHRKTEANALTQSYARIYIETQTHALIHACMSVKPTSLTHSAHIHACNALMYSATSANETVFVEWSECYKPIHAYTINSS